MDRGGYDWGEDGATNHNTFADEMDGGSSDGHHYYCPVNVGGACSCPVEEHTNNNDYSQLKKNKNPKRKHYSGYGDESQYCTQYDASFTESSMYHSTSDSTTQHSFPYENSEDPSSIATCTYCHRNYDLGVSGRCQHCDAHQNASYCDYFDTSRRYGGGSGTPQEEPQGPPKIQVTAKLLFGTVGAISDLKQKKAAKKN